MRRSPNKQGSDSPRLRSPTKFFGEIVANPVPVDLRALRALRQSPMAIDLYCWLTYRNFSLRSPTTVPWEALKLQFGSGAEAEKKFRETVKRALLQVVEVYPQANVVPTKAGLALSPSQTRIHRLVKHW
ncbi:replication protein RepA [Caballeronia humi]|uniref:Plasmid replication protein n=1 Tax=Caballeronia humi TaxID=326474 RepID=A0A158JFM2_9BURK|nr:replication protein RepA [Caballeronia humi]SAL67672.1 plasmid replication protein [Caballeronia humi]